MRQRLVLCLVIWVVALSCARMFRPARAVKPDVVGVVLPLSGDYQALGKTVLAGIELAFSKSTIQMITRDSHGTAEGAIAALNELSSEGVIAALGGIGNEESRALANRADQLGIPLITLSKDDQITSAGSYVFQNMLTLKAQAAAIASYAACQLGQRRFSILAPQTEFGAELSTAFADAVNRLGGTVVQHHTYPAEQTSFTGEAKRLTGRFEPEKREDFIRERARITKEETDPTRRSNAIEKMKKSLEPIVDFDAVFIADGWKTASLIAPALAYEDLITTGCDAADAERIRQTTGKQNLKTVTLLGWSAWSAPEGAGGVSELVTRGGKFVNCSVYVDGFFAASSRGPTKEFVAKFKKANSRPPDFLAALGFDSAKLYRQVIESAAPLDSAAFRNALERTENFEGATGTTWFDDDRVAKKPPFFIKVEAAGLRDAPQPRTCAQ